MSSKYFLYTNSGNKCFMRSFITWSDQIETVVYCIPGNESTSTSIHEILYTHKLIIYIQLGLSIQNIHTSCEKNGAGLIEKSCEIKGGGQEMAAMM